MADSHPFSNAGLGMFGADTSIARQAATPEGLAEKIQKGDPFLFAVAALADKFLSKDKGMGGDQGDVEGAIPAPQMGGSSAPVAPFSFTESLKQASPSTGGSYRGFLDMLPNSNK